MTDIKKKEIIQSRDGLLQTASGMTVVEHRRMKGNSSGMPREVCLHQDNDQHEEHG